MDETLTIETVDFSADSAATIIDSLESQIPDLELRDHLKGSWPSSKNVSQ
jgi:hypothetical protein